MSGDFQQFDDPNLQEVVFRELTTLKIVNLAHLLAREATRRYDDAWRITVPEFRVLMVLGEGTRLSATDITERAQMDKGQTSRVIKQMEAANLLVRDRDTTDARRTLHALTPRGKRLYRDAIERTRDRQNQLSTVLEDSELETLHRALDKLEARVRDLLKNEKARPRRN